MNMKINSIVKILILAPFLAMAQVEDTTITHTVKSGDTMNSITREYLGTDILWKENWKLNPQVKNPHLLTIGQKLTVIKERIIPAEKATMRKIINNVEKKLIVGDWLQAQTGDNLQQQEGVRTLEASSTVLEFNETSSLKILEFSQVFLKSRKTSLSGTDSSTIEIIEGDAELKWEPLNIKNSEIEIISGQTKLIPESANGKVTSIRTGIAENGNSVVSVYEGKSNIQSAGTQVSVPKGMGVSVKQGEKPPKPKPLLKSPVVDTNLINQSYAYSNPILMWQKVELAKNYLVEICYDKNCSQIFEQLKTESDHVQLSKVPDSGDYYWRVAAVSQDDLVGFKSKPIALNITQAKADVTGPAIAINVIGKQQENTDSLIIAANAKIKILALDNQSGFDKIYYKWNQGELVYLTDANALLDIQTGELTIQALDKLGNESIKTYLVSYK